MQTPGAIGYIEYGFGKLTGTPMAIAARTPPANSSPRAARAAPRRSPPPSSTTEMRAFITDPQGADAYPIATFTWMVFYEHGQDATKVAAIKEMIEYGLTEGQAQAEELGYIPLPEAVIEKVRAAAAGYRRRRLIAAQPASARPPGPPAAFPIRGPR